MADKPEKPRPTYDVLAAENAALRARVSSLETDAMIRENEARWPKKKPRELEPKAKSAFDRPWDGR